MTIRRQSMSRANGYIIICDPDKPDEEHDTIRCVHCAAHYPYDSHGMKGGFCTNCNGWICGEKCLECVPAEKWLDIQEGTVNPTAVSVPVKQSIILP